MTVYLLDVNALVALAWPKHVHNQAIRTWLLAHSHCHYATCPLTQCGFLRISSNPKIIPSTRGVGEAFESLDKIVSHPRHVFWPDSAAMSNSPAVERNRIQGHQQITDAYLLALCLERGGILATFDRKISSLLADDAGRKAIETIAT